MTQSLADFEKSNVKLAELRAKHEKEFAEAVKNEKTKSEVMAALGLTEENFAPGFMHVHKADCYIVVAADTLPDALVMCERMNPLQMVRITGTFCSFRAELSVTEKEYKENEILPIPYCYKIDGLRQHNEEKTLVWFVEAAGYTVEVRCKVKNDPLTYRSYEITFNRSGDGVKKRDDLVNKSGYFQRSNRFWSSLDQPSTYVLS